MAESNIPKGHRDRVIRLGPCVFEFTHNGIQLIALFRTENSLPMVVAIGAEMCWALQERVENQLKIEEVKARQAQQAKKTGPG